MVKHRTTIERMPWTCRAWWQFGCPKPFPLWIETYQSSSTVRCPPHFNPHHPCGDRPVCSWRNRVYRRISIHDPLADGGCPPVHTEDEHLRFNPHHPYGWWPSTVRRNLMPPQHFNPHHPCGWWLYRQHTALLDVVISTHTIPANRDQHPAHHLRRFRTISILAILKGKPMERLTPAVRHSLSKSGKISYNYLNYTILLSNRQSSKRHSLSFSFGGET